MSLVRLSGQPRAEWFEKRSSRLSSLTDKSGGGRRLPFRSLRPLHKSKPALIRLLKSCGLSKRGLQNAQKLSLAHNTLEFAELPEAFDSMSILLITDLHMGGPLDVCRCVAELVRGMSVDLCVFGGDYTYDEWLKFSEVRGEFAPLLSGIDAREGCVAVLGNNDRPEVSRDLEELGVKVLINETYALMRGDQKILVTGTDDPHTFYSSFASEVLAEPHDGFRVALVHSVELADEAARGGCNLYLAGHSHGGQICLPGGLPLVTRVRKNRRLTRGLWNYKGMTGYTSRGAGVSGVPARFNCRGEVTLLTLRRRNK